MAKTAKAAKMETAPADEKETASEKFVRLAQARVSNVIHGLRSVGKLGNAAVYEWSPEQAAKIVSALTAEVEKVRVCLLPPKAGVKVAKVPGFTL